MTQKGEDACLKTRAANTRCGIFTEPLKALQWRGGLLGLPAMCGLECGWERPLV